MKKLVFDFDGTLVDSMPTWANKMFYVLQKRGIAYPDDLIKTVTPLGDRGTAEYYIEKLKVNALVEELMTDMDEYALEGYAHTIPAKKFVKEKLLQLKAKGYSLNVLTASPHKMLDVCLKRVELYDLFDNVWSCDDFSMTKSDVRIYEEVAKRLDTTVENCIFFDDNIGALQTAKKAGMEVVGVYDESSKAYEEEIKKLSNRYVYTFAELDF